MAGALPAVADGRNNPWLDLVRSLAIILVLFRHGERAIHADVGQPQTFLQAVFMNGWVGVDVFFVLSGYLIARHLLNAGIASGRFEFRRYVVMRALRIVPAYAAVMALIVAGAFPFYTLAPDNLARRILYHVLFLQDYLPSDINVAFWSLGVEEKFYLLAPPLIVVLLRCRTAWLTGGLLLLLFALPAAMRAAVFFWLDEGIDYRQFFPLFRSPFHMTLEGLVMGLGIAVAQNAGYVRTSRRSGLPLLSVATMVLLGWLGTHDLMAEIGVFDVTLQPVLVAVLAGLMTLGAVQLAGTPMWFTRPVRALSRLSYSLYLVHLPLIPMVTALAAPGGWFGFWSLYLLASLWAATLLHFLVERPFLLWKDRVGRGESAIQPRAPGVAPAAE
jgi:peptidoglycan/LPS O-acetylase OafA/YrhL